MRNFAALAIADMLFRIASVSLIVFISRRFGPQSLGELTFAQGVIAYATLTTDLGLTLLAIREISQRRWDTSRIAVAATAAQVTAAVVLQLVLVVTINRLPVSADTRSLTLAFGLVMIAQSLSMVYALQAAERMPAVAWLRTLMNTGGLAVGFAALVVSGSLVSLPLGAAAATLLADGICVYLLRSAGMLQLHLPDPRFVVALLRKAAPLLVFGLAVQLLLNFDAIAIGTMRGERELGYYAAPYRLVTFGLSVGGIAMAALFPRLSSMAGAERSIDPLLPRISRFFGALALPAAAVLFVLAPEILGFTYGPPYARSARVLQILALVPALGLLNMLLGQVLVILGAQVQLMSVAVVAACLNVALNLWLIPQHGIVGAAVANAASEAATVMMFLVLMRSRISLWSTLQAYTASLPVALGTGTALIVGKELGLGFIIEIGGVGLLSYCLLTGIFNRRIVLDLYRDLRGEVG